MSSSRSGGSAGAIPRPVNARSKHTKTMCGVAPAANTPDTDTLTSSGAPPSMTPGGVAPVAPNNAMSGAEDAATAAALPPDFGRALADMTEKAERPPVSAQPMTTRMSDAPKAPPDRVPARSVPPKSNPSLNKSAPPRSSPSIAPRSVPPISKSSRAPLAPRAPSVAPPASIVPRSAPSIAPASGANSQRPAALAAPARPASAEKIEPAPQSEPSVAPTSVGPYVPPSYDPAPRTDPLGSPVVRPPPSGPSPMPLHGMATPSALPLPASMQGPSPVGTRPRANTMLGVAPQGGVEGAAGPHGQSSSFAPPPLHPSQPPLQPPFPPFEPPPMMHGQSAPPPLQMAPIPMMQPIAPVRPPASTPNAFSQGPNGTNGAYALTAPDPNALTYQVYTRDGGVPTSRHSQVSFSDVTGGRKKPPGMSVAARVCLVLVGVCVVVLTSVLIVVGASDDPPKGAANGAGAKGASSASALPAASASPPPVAVTAPEPPPPPPPAAAVVDPPPAPARAAAKTKGAATAHPQLKGATVPPNPFAGGGGKTAPKKK